MHLSGLQILMHLKAQAPQWEHGFQFVELPLQCHLLWLKTYSDAGSRFMLHQGERDRERQMEEWESCVGLKVKSHVRGHQDYLEARKAARGEENTYNKSVSQGKEPFSKALHPRDQHLGQDDFCVGNTFKWNAFIIQVVCILLLLNGSLHFRVALQYSVL